MTQMIELGVGHTVELERTFTLPDNRAMAALCRDDNPIYEETDRQAHGRFLSPVVHPLLLYGLICQGMNGEAFGQGSWPVEQSLMYPTGVNPGEKLRAHLQITQVEAQNFVHVLATVEQPDGDPGCVSHSVVSVNKSPGHKAYFSNPKEALHWSRLPWTSPKEMGSLRLGQMSAVKRIFTAVDVDRYRQLSGDENPFYHDYTAALEAGFEDTPLPPPLLAALFAHLLGSVCPGPGSSLLRQRLLFARPGYPGEEFTASVEVIYLSPQRQTAQLRLVETSQSGETICEGEALVFIPE